MTDSPIPRTRPPAQPADAGPTAPGANPPAMSRAVARRLVLPLALAQFIASYAATNMNVAISDIAHDLNTTVEGLQTAITLFTLTMAALMIPGSKLTDVWGRKRCFMGGLTVYGVGALVAALAPSLGIMTFGYSILEGVGSALMIPPIYILVTVLFSDLATRARYFGVISGAAGLGAAAGPLIGGFVTTVFGWRASFVLQVIVIVTIIWLARGLTDPPQDRPAPRFDVVGAVLSAAGLFFLVLGILLTRSYGWLASRQDFTIGGTVVIPQGGVSPIWIFVLIGVVILAWFFLHLRAAERAGREPLLHTRLFKNRTANLGLGTQTIQWLVLQGSFFTISVFLQEVRGFSAISTGLLLTPATIGILAASAGAERLAGRRPQRWLVVAGFFVTAVGMGLLLALVRTDSAVWTFVPGLLLMGLGVGVMLTSSVTIVQSSFSDADQGDISGLSRSVSNLGSSFGTALVGSVLVAAASTTQEGRSFAVAQGVLLGFSLVGLVLGVLIPGRHGLRARA